MSLTIELPDELEFFIHRVGRTARAGLEGTAITLYDPSEEDKIVRIEANGNSICSRRSEKWPMG